MKGIILNYKTIKQIYEYTPEKLTLEEINKLSKLNQKRISINKREFVQIINVLGDLINKEAFNNIDESQLFFINLNNSIAEFDILTILAEKDKNVILNIEVKESMDEEKKEEVEIKLSSQLHDRIEDHLQQMFIDDIYMTIGYINKKFYKALYKEKGKDIEELSENVSLERIKNLKHNFQAYSKLQVSDNLSSIQGVYTKLKNNTFKMYAINKRVLENINNSLQSDNKVIMCLAKPGYGKTVLALSLFFNNEDTKLLILNEKFYNTFYMSEYYVSNRAFYGTHTYISQLNEDSIAIIDEAQRLGKEDLKRIIEKAKKVILFGDTGQAFMKTDQFIDDNSYEKAVEEIVGNNYKKIRLKNSIRYPEEVDRALKYLYDRRSEKRDLLKIYNFDINIFNTKEDFIRAYNSIAESKKIFKMYTSSKLDEIISVKIDKDEFNFYMVGRKEWNFAISGNIPGFGHTLHAISFDIENVFLYLDNLVYSERRNMPIPDNIDEFDDVEYKKYINELDILLTRAKKSLNIYVEDLRTFLWFNEKIAEINNASEETV